MDVALVSYEFSEFFGRRLKSHLIRNTASAKFERREGLSSDDGVPMNSQFEMI